MLASVAEQASLSLTWSETPEDTFSHDEAHVYLSMLHYVLECNDTNYNPGNVYRRRHGPGYLLN